MAQEETHAEADARKVHADGRIELTAEEARQGQIVLTTRRRKLLFFGGLVAFVLLALLGALFAR